MVCSKGWYARMWMHVKAGRHAGCVFGEERRRGGAGAGIGGLPGGCPAVPRCWLGCQSRHSSPIQS